MDWKDKLNALYDAVPKSEENNASTEDVQNKPVSKKQQLRVELDKRNGKPATLVTEFQGTDDELKELAKLLKVKCGTGGSARGGEILIQGDFRAKVASILEEEGYKVRRINFK
ncbi:translation initiation factor [Paludibacter sp. 221]|uniref:translation initiation factor n=1 Tax=Paludibacter sp. 221 TaxID=2302939 RepID=UPI0013D70E68|nr:translation initiation factor [Paludibacter sp. 221]NDV45755.1 translation initiation factor [Paludibacter sp. 221]